MIAVVSSGKKLLIEGTTVEAVVGNEFMLNGVLQRVVGFGAATQPYVLTEAVELPEVGDVVECHSGCIRVYAGNGEVFRAAVYTVDANIREDYDNSYKCSVILNTTPTERIKGYPEFEVGDVIDCAGVARLYAGNGKVFFADLVKGFDGLSGLALWRLPDVPKIMHPTHTVKATEKPEFLLQEVDWCSLTEQFEVYEEYAQVGEVCTIEGAPWRIVGFTNNADWAHGMDMRANPCSTLVDYKWAILRKLTLTP